MSKVISKAEYTVVQVDDGKKGDQGPPTGVTVGNTEPTIKFVNMLWQDTSQTPPELKVWSGTDWNTYFLYVVNLVVDKLSAMSGILGEVEAGTIRGSQFINEFINVPLLYNENSKASGFTTIADGETRIQGKIDNTYPFVTRQTVDVSQSVIYQTDGVSVKKQYSLTPEGLMLVDNDNNFKGIIKASALTLTPWITLALKTGYAVAEGNPPQYKITYNLDGTKTINFRGQFKLSNGTDMLAGRDNNPMTLPASICPLRTSMAYGPANNGTGSNIYISTTGYVGCIIGSGNAGYVEMSNVYYQIN